MQRIELLTALPGCCWKCRSSNREWYLDLDISIDFYGAVFICCECIVEMCHIAGMVTAEEADKLQTQVSFLEELKFDQEVKISGLEQAIDGLRIAGRSLGVNSFPPSSGIDDSIKSSAPTGTTELELQGNRSTQQVHDKGVAELSNDGGPKSESAFKLSL